MSGAPSGFVLKGWHVLLIFVAFFGVVIAVNAWFITDAYRTFPGETSVTPYEDGLAYNAALRQKQAQEALGWAIAVGVADGVIQVDVRDRTGAPLSGLKASAHLHHPATDSGERWMTLRPAGRGAYVADRAPRAGGWDVEIVVTDGAGHTARAERRLAAS